MAKEIDYVELLKLAHEKLGSQSDMIELLKGKIFKQSQESKEAVSRAIEIILEKDDKIAELEKALQRQTKRVKLLEPLLESQPSSEGEFWVELEESLNQEEALKEQDND